MADSKGLNLEAEEELSREELMYENRQLKQKSKDAIKFALILGVIALIAMGFVVGIMVNLSISDDKVCNNGTSTS